MISSKSFESALKKQRQKPIIEALKNLCIIAVLGKKRHENIFELVRLINNVSIYVVVLNNLICIEFIARFFICFIISLIVGLFDRFFVRGGF
ncbi:hypothetical protein AFK20_06775 [Enhydrobacter aerosaccus]|uniref:Uncharacterized protein n=1 Tax=Enhydrobacter aerosaccus TaxID=225324 RepID=A0ABR5ILM0_9HYPH|nr:hypothetical protein AFK20_06775 [Enhydrobacter aerosaccus]